MSYQETYWRAQTISPLVFWQGHVSQNFCSLWAIVSQGKPVQDSMRKCESAWASVSQIVHKKAQQEFFEPKWARANLQTKPFQKWFDPSMQLPDKVVCVSTHIDHFPCVKTQTFLYAHIHPLLIQQNCSWTHNVSVQNLFSWLWPTFIKPTLGCLSIWICPQLVHCPNLDCSGLESISFH